MNDASFESELQNVFLTEAEEMLEDTEAAFVAIESNPDDSAKIAKIFRLVHTIKGSAHVAGFTQLGKFAHVFETLLGALREENIRANSEVVDILLEGNDRLKEYVSTLRQDPHALLDSTNTELRITNLVANSQQMAKPEVTKPAKNRQNKAQSELDFATDRANISQTSIVGGGDAATFLIVDDEPSIREILSDCLTNRGFSVIAVSSAKEALDIFRTTSIDVIMTDLSMPEMDGISLATAIRSVNEYIPIGFISGHSSRNHLKDYLRLGVHSFIDKPFQSIDIVTTAYRLLREAKIRKAMLAVSKSAFQAYVTMERILSTLHVDPTHHSDRIELDACLKMMRDHTIELLSSERNSFQEGTVESN